MYWSDTWVGKAKSGCINRTRVISRLHDNEILIEIVYPLKRKKYLGMILMRKSRSHFTSSRMFP